MNGAMPKQPIGNMILLTKKSVASKIFSEKMSTFASRFDDNADGIAAQNTTSPVHHVTTFRERF